MVFTVRDLNARGQVKLARQPVVSTIPISPWRWMALLAVVAGLAHAKVHATLGGPTVEALLAAHGNPLLPSHAAFEVWGLVQVALLAFVLVQLVQSQRGVAAYDRVAGLVVLASITASFELVTLDANALWVTTSLASALAVIAAAAYVRVQREIAAEHASPWLAVPFSLLLGATGVAAIASLDASITAAGCPSLAPSLGLIAVAGAAAVYLGLHHRDFVLPGLVGWLVATVAAHTTSPAPVASAALFVGAVAATAAVVIYVASRARSAAPLVTSRRTQPASRPRW